MVVDPPVVFTGFVPEPKINRFLKSGVVILPYVVPSHSAQFALGTVEPVHMIIPPIGTPGGPVGPV